MKTPKGFFTYFHHEEVLQELTDEDAGRLYKDLLHYGNTGELPDYHGYTVLDVAFTLFRIEIDHNVERYQKVCEARSQAGKKSARVKKERAAKALSDDDEVHELKTFTAAELMRGDF